MNRTQIVIAVVVIVIIVLGGAWFGGYFDQPAEVTTPAPTAGETTTEPAGEATDAAPEAGDAAPEPGETAPQTESQAGAS